MNQNPPAAGDPFPMMEYFPLYTKIPNPKQGTSTKHCPYCGSVDAQRAHNVANFWRNSEPLISLETWICKECMKQWIRHSDIHPVTRLRRLLAAATPEVRQKYLGANPRMIQPQPEDVEPCEFCIPLLAIGCLLDPDDRVGCTQRIECWLSTGAFPGSSQHAPLVSPNEGIGKQSRSVQELT